MMQSLLAMANWFLTMTTLAKHLSGDSSFYVTCSITNMLLQLFVVANIIVCCLVEPEITFVVTKLGMISMTLTTWKHFSTRIKRNLCELRLLRVPKALDPSQHVLLFLTVALSGFTVVRHHFIIITFSSWKIYVHSFQHWNIVMKTETLSLQRWLIFAAIRLSGVLNLWRNIDVHVLRFLSCVEAHTAILFPYHQKLLPQSVLKFLNCCKAWIKIFQISQPVVFYDIPSLKLIFGSGFLISIARVWRTFTYHLPIAHISTCTFHKSRSAASLSEQAGEVSDTN